MRIDYPIRINLANLPTRIEKLDFLSKELGGPEIFIKRDDLTGCATSGNKIRKLEFALARAINEGADTIITCGWVNSNHVRATALTAAKKGLNCILLLRGEKPESIKGNLFLDIITGAEVRFLPPEQYENVYKHMSKIIEELKNRGKKGYAIPSGATDSTGIWGYIKAAEEINNQIPRIDNIIVPVGTGGTYAGLFIGKKLLEWDVTLYGISVEKDEKFHKKEILDIIKNWEKNNTILDYSKKDIKVIEGYQGEGYSKFNNNELEIIKLLAENEGIILDPVYTAKAMRGLIGEVKKNKFKSNESILFLHTGGIFGLLSLTDEIKL
jgi:D-cysteine desulfhydrase